MPVLVAAHDHEPFLLEVDGVKVIKVGQNADHIGFITFEWDDGAALGTKPKVTMEMKNAKVCSGQGDSGLSKAAQASFDRAGGVYTLLYPTDESALLVSREFV